MRGRRGEDGVLHPPVAAELGVREQRRQRLLEVVAEVDVRVPARRAVRHRRAFARKKPVRQERLHHAVGHRPGPRRFVGVAQHAPGERHRLAEGCRIVHVGGLHERLVEPLDDEVRVPLEARAPTLLQLPRQPVAEPEDCLAEGDLREHGDGPPLALEVVVESAVLPAHRGLRPVDGPLRRREALLVPRTRPAIGQRIGQVADAPVQDAARGARDGAVEHPVARSRDLPREKGVAPPGDKPLGGIPAPGRRRWKGVGFHGSDSSRCYRRYSSASTP